MIRLSVLALTALLVLPLPAAAQGASEASVRQYMDLTNADRGLNQIGRALLQSIVSQLRTQNPAITDETLRTVGEKVVAVMQANTDSYRDLVAATLQQVLTEEEVQAAIQFFGSPVGRSFSSKLPQLEQASAGIGREWVAGIQGEVSQAVQSVLEQ